jgi:hypothetical protein
MSEKLVENFLVNPPKKHRKAKRRHAKKRHNPIGESLMIAGLNPFRKRHMRHNSWFGHSKQHSTAAKKGRKHRKAKHNPAIAMSTKGILGFDPLKEATFFSSAFGGAIVTTAAPRLIGPMIKFGTTGWQKYATEVLTVIASGLILRSFKATKGDISEGFVTGGWIAVGVEALREYILPMIPGVSKLAGLEDYRVGEPAFGPGYTALADYRVMGDVGAFPETSHLGAFPDISTSDYSYDRDTDKYMEYEIPSHTAVSGW